MSTNPRPAPAAAAPDPINMRRRILDASARLFREHGFYGTTTRAIAEIVGILSGSLFHHFRSKEQILVEVMSEAAIQLCERAAAAIADVDTPRERLRALIRLQLDCLIAEHTRDYYAVLIGEWRMLDEAAKPILTARRIEYSAIWNKVLEECARDGLLRDEPRALQFVLHGAINWASTWFKPSGRMTLEEYARILEDLVLERTAPGRKSARRGR